ncbi:TIGR00730 family Rossman fold protein [uncultured Faecalibaculum sp.]|uniref:LOG family protein n=1 Tax=uncultured Faecalibaculum sp. TaxID=1729681 RepID=UPI002612C7A3|nr:TIGR00730 family Rossman fold protein [uncultured Faecalibaculum sp.]
MKVCVYGASSDKIAPVYKEAGRELGIRLADADMTLIFGGGMTGMMGAVLAGVQEAGGQSIGISPRYFDVPGVLAKSCTEFYFTDTMRQRKQMMEEMADAFIMTPGSIGTFEEFFEILTLKQVNQTAKPLTVLDTNGYFEPMMAMLENAVEQKFIDSYVFDLFRVFVTPAEVVDWLEHCELTEETAGGFLHGHES